MGGMVVLMNQALDTRFNITVALAPLVNFLPPQYGIMYDENFINFIPVNLLNIENTHNLLIIMHVEDEILDYTENALVAKKLTNCTVIPIEGFLLGGGHQLFSDKVLIESINWFEAYFFKSTTINGPIIITFYWNYILIFINILLLFTILISLISVSSRIFFRKNNSKEVYLQKTKSNSEPLNKKIQMLKICLIIGIFLFNWFIFERFFGIKGILYGSIVFIIIYSGFKILLYLKKPYSNKINISFKKFLRSQFNLKYIMFTIICTMYFIAIYMIFTFYYPFGFIWPSNFIIHFALGYLALPVFMATEILIRKVIYPQLRILKSERSKNRILTIISVIIILSLMLLSMCFSIIPSGFFMYLIFLMVIIQNTKIMQNVKAFYPVVLISFTIIQIFFAAVLSNAIGVNLAL
jgi:hypothetical protein